MKNNKYSYSIPKYAVYEDGKIFGFFGPFNFLSNYYILETGVCLDDLSTSRQKTHLL